MTKTQKERTSYAEVREMSPDELDKTFKMPKCKVMNDKEVEEKAKVSFKFGRIMR